MFSSNGVHYDCESVNATEEEARRIQGEEAMDTRFYGHENGNTQGQGPLVRADPVDSNMEVVTAAEFPGEEPLPSSPTATQNKMAPG
ncbi:hypothetical protein ACLMJK_008554 [Lecanora helva]